MNKYVYPAIFTEENGCYSISFPDLDNCYTCAESLDESLEMAEDVLALTLYGYEKNKKPIPTPSKLTDISVDSNSFVNYVKADTLEYRKMYNNKSVKKTLSIPEWLNEISIEMNLNFSQILQEALIKRINL